MSHGDSCHSTCFHHLFTRNSYTARRCCLREGPEGHQEVVHLDPVDAASRGPEQANHRARHGREALLAEIPHRSKRWRRWRTKDATYNKEVGDGYDLLACLCLVKHASR